MCNKHGVAAPVNVSCATDTSMHDNPCVPLLVNLTAKLEIVVLIATGKVAKLRGSAPVIDGRQEVTAALSTKQGYGTLHAVTLAIGASRQLMKWWVGR